MYRIVTDPDLRAELTRRGHENVKRFSWEKCARETLAVLEASANGVGGAAGDERTPDASIRSHPRRSRRCDHLDGLARLHRGVHCRRRAAPDLHGQPGVRDGGAAQPRVRARCWKRADLCIAGRRRAAVGRKAAGQAAAGAGHRLGRRAADRAAGGGARVGGSFCSARARGSPKRAAQILQRALSRAAGGRHVCRLARRCRRGGDHRAASGRRGPTSCSWRTARRSRTSGSRSTGRGAECRS